MYKIIDTSTKTTNITDQLRNAGIRTVIRYYDSFGRGEKLLEKNEAIALSQAGLDIMVVFENSNEPGDFTFDKGIADGSTAIDWAKNQINQPPYSAIYFAVDYDANPTELENSIIPYFQGIEKAFETQSEYTVGAYGSGLVINKLKDLELCEYRWLSQSIGFYGSREALQDRNYELHQIAPSTTLCGIGVDYDIQNPEAQDIGSFRLNANESL